MASPLIHHVSVINRDKYVTFDFYHKVLGLQFLLKTVNQDDIDMLHLFFGDETGRPGTEFSVFEVPHGQNKQYGTNTLERTIFAVPTDASLDFWYERFTKFDVFNCEIEEWQGRRYLMFEDRDGMQLGLTPLRVGSADEHFPHVTADIPAEHAILGIDSFQCRVRYADASARAFGQTLDLQIVEELEHNGQRVIVLSKEDVLFGQQIHLIEDRKRDVGVEGVGSVQHIALNAKDHDNLVKVEEKIVEINFRYSGIKERDFFEALYYREPNSLLIEVATEQTHFEPIEGPTDDYDAIPYVLPEFLEEKRAYIERTLK